MDLVYSRSDNLDGEVKLGRESRCDSNLTRDNLGGEVKLRKVNSDM